MVEGFAWDSRVWFETFCATWKCVAVLLLLIDHELGGSPPSTSFVATLLFLAEVQVSLLTTVRTPE